MKKVIKIGFPILCVAVVGGTFMLLNRATSKITRNRLVEAENIVIEENIIENQIEDNIEENNIENSIGNNIDNSIQNKLDNSTTILQDDRIQEVKNKAKAIELVKRLTPPTTDTYYTNEGMEGKKYLVAIRENKTNNVKIYYSVDIGSEEIEIYVK